MKLKLISDGTPIGTKLIDEDTGEQVHGISKISADLDNKELLSKVTVEFFNIPIDLQVNANIDLIGWVPEGVGTETGFKHLKSYDKDVHITTSLKEKLALVSSTKILDKLKSQLLGAVQWVKFVATPEKVETKMEKIKFGPDEYL